MSSDSGPIVEYSRGRVQCTLCEVLISDSQYNIQQHLDGRLHTTKLMSENGICLDDISYCKPCKIYFPYTTNDIQDHINSNYHINWIDTMDELVDGQCLDLDAYLSSEKSVYDIYCELCNCRIPCAATCVEQHIEGSRHMAARTTMVMPLNGIFEVDGDATVWCKLCDLYIDNCTEDILDHTDSDHEHVRIINDFEDLIEGENISIDAYLKELSCDKAFCADCNVPIPCTYKNLLEHINGYRHSQ